MRSGEKTRRLALCAMLAALGVVFLYLGALIEVLDLSLAAFVPLLVVYVAIELGGYWPWLLYGVTGVLAFLLLPQKFGAIVYLLFTGYYPMLKKWSESKLPRPFRLLFKLVVFNLALLASWFLIKLFVGEVLLEVAWYYVLAFCEVTFLLYDFVLTRLITVYVYKLRKRFKIKKGD